MRTFFSHKHWSLLTLILAVSVLSVSVMAEEPATNPLDQLAHLDTKDLPNMKDVQKLLHVYMMNNSPADSPCFKYLKELYANNTNAPENDEAKEHRKKVKSDMFEAFMASGKRINDFGDQFACRRLKNFTYLHLMFKIKNRTDRALIGLCSPSQCSVKDYQAQEAAITGLLNKTLGAEAASFDVVFIDPQVEEDKIDYDIYGYLALLIMGTIIVLGTMGSIYDLQGVSSRPSAHREFQQGVKKVTAPTAVEFSEVSNFSARPTMVSIETEVESEPSGSTQLTDKLPMGQVLLSEQPLSFEKPRFNFVTLCKCFSFYTNGKKLFATNKITDDVASTECLNGFRVLTMLWVILGHSFYYHLRAPVLNLHEYLSFVQAFKNQFFVACPLSVDSFLFLGGFLGAYLMLKEVRKRNGRLNFLQVWIHRFYRIVPLYMLILLWGWKIMPTFIVGVGGHNYKELIDSDCQGVWWTNLLFLNNFLPNGKTASCFGHSWYLAVDMQCFLPLPILLVIYYKNRTAGWIATLSLFFGTILLWFVNSLIHHWATDLQWIMEHYDEYFVFYVYPYYRFPPYGLGIIVGLLISEHKDERLGHNIFAKRLYRFWRARMFRYLTYLIGVAIIVWSILIHYPVNNGDANKNWNQFEKSLFMSTQRSIWVFGWALLFMPAMMGWGSLLRGVLGASFWSPLTRLTFGAYLIHPILQLWYYWGLEQGWLIGSLNSVFNMVGFATASYLLSIGFSLMAEAPAMNLEKFWMPPRRGGAKEALKE